MPHTLWHDVRKRVGSLGAIRETQTFKTIHCILIYCSNMAEILLKPRKTSNPSITLWQLAWETSIGPDVHITKNRW
jgi:hypothetical protein